MKHDLFGAANDTIRQSKTRAYSVWRNMISRCYSGRFIAYVGCTVSIDWMTFSIFKAWYDKNSLNESFHVDKDLLVPGNKIYSESTCCCIPVRLNTIFNKSLDGGIRVKYNKFVVRMSFGNSKAKRLKSFDSKEDAKSFYENEKKKEIIRYATELQKSGVINDAVFEAAKNKAFSL